MREIKFRAWDNRLKRMMSAFFVGSVFGDIFATKNILSDDVTEISRVGRERYILTQFTGLKDKNGKDIYEGDILKPVNPPSTKKDNRVVEFIDGSFCYNESTTRGNRGYWALNSRKTRLFEIIGNIYENPELLK